MDAKQTGTVYLLCCGNWRREPSEIELTAWEVAFRGADNDTVAATVEHMLSDDPRPAKDRAFMPRPSDIMELCRRVDGEIPPTLDEAVGLYLADDHSHPLVAKAIANLGRMRLDPHCPDPAVARAATFEFRNAYASVLGIHEDDKLRPAREAIEAGSPGAELLAILGGEE